MKKIHCRLEQLSGIGRKFFIDTGVLMDFNFTIFPHCDVIRPQRIYCPCHIYEKRSVMAGSYFSDNG